jgi:transposase-like protein
MGTTKRRKYTDEFKAEAAILVVEGVVAIERIMLEVDIY